MSHIIPMSKVNQFLPVNKLELDTTNDGQTGLPVDHSKISGLEETARDIVISKLSYRIDTANWFDPIDPPNLIINIMGMLIAGWVYDRQFAEESTEGASYGKHKEAEAYELIEGILQGLYKIDAPYIDDPDRVPSVYETEPVFVMEFRP